MALGGGLTEQSDVLKKNFPLDSGGGGGKEIFPSPIALLLPCLPPN